jgi:hypothetical protein
VEPYQINILASAMFRHLQQVHAPRKAETGNANLMDAAYSDIKARVENG